MYTCQIKSIECHHEAPRGHPKSKWNHLSQPNSPLNFHLQPLNLFFSQTPKSPKPHLLPLSTTPNIAMTINSKPLTFFLVILFLFISSISLLARSAEDPEVELCKKQCQLQTQFDKQQRRICQYQCQDYGRQKAEAAGVGERERELQRCEHQCRSSQLSEEEEEECARKCEEHRKAARDGERGEGREERLEHCRHQCQSVEEGRRGQHECTRECEER